MVTKRYYWIKLKDSFFKQLAIKKLRKVAGGDTFVIIYLKMMLLSMNNESKITYECNDGTEFAENLALDLDENENNVNITLAFLKSHNLIEFTTDGEAFLPEAKGCIGCETAEAEKKRKQRALPKLTNGSIRINGELMRLPSGKTRYVDEKRYGGYGMFVLDREQGKCQMCGNDENTVIHHANEFSNNPDDLMVLCKSCHAKLHAKMKEGDKRGTLSTPCPAAVPENVPLDIRDKRIDKDIDILPPHNTKYISNGGGGGEEFNLFVAVENALRLPMTRDLADKFIELLNEVGEGVLKEALDESVKYNGRSYAYVEAVARRIASGGKGKTQLSGAIDVDAIRKLMNEGNQDAND